MITTAIIYEPFEVVEAVALNMSTILKESQDESDSDSENAIILPESFENVLVTASTRIPSALLINDYGRVSLNKSFQTKSSDEDGDLNRQIRSLIDKTIMEMKAFSLAIGGNGLCSVRIDQGPAIIYNPILNDKRIRVAISGDVVLYQ